MPILLVIAAALAGCTADNGKSDPGMSARSSTVVTPATHPSETPTQSIEQTPPPSQMTGWPVIVCFGDSITAGYGVEPSLNYPADLQRDLIQAGYKYRVVNLGVSGETTKDGLARVNHVLALKPEWVILEFGGNDGLRGLPIRDSQQNLTAMVTALRHGGAKVMVAAISLPTQYGQDYINQFEAIFPTVTKQTNVPLLPFAQFSKGVYGVAGNIQEDDIHPTASGDRALAKNVGAALMPMLRK